MKVLLCALLLSPASAQDQRKLTPAVQKRSQDDRAPANANGENVNRSVIKPKPGALAIKPKDPADATGYFHPFGRMGR